MRKKVIILCSLLLTLASAHLHAAPLGTAFTYQGRLTDATGLANGSYDLQFDVYSAASTGNRIGSTVTNTGVAVSNGLFTTSLDFGVDVDVFTGGPRWLEIGVRTNGTLATFTILAPRQPLTATPYALFANSAAAANSATVASSVSPNAVTGAGIQDGVITAAKVGSGQVVKSLNGLMDNVTLVAGPNVALTPSGNGLQISSVSPAASWALGGNTGTIEGHFLGTGDNQPLEFKVNGSRALRLEPNSSGAPNVIGGSSVNRVSDGIVGAVIGGGGASDFNGFSYINEITANFGTIGGGIVNSVSANVSTIGGGSGNSIYGVAHGSTISGGYANVINSYYSTVNGGTQNQIRPNAEYSSISGGSGNLILPQTRFGTIAGGSGNTLRYGPYGSIAGGVGNTIGHDVAQTGDFASVGGGIRNAAQANYSIVSGGCSNQIQASSIGAAIGGGSLNIIEDSASFSTMGGGLQNLVKSNSSFSTIAGGTANIIPRDAPYGTISGGGNNTMRYGSYGTIAGGYQNTIGYDVPQTGHYASVGGGYQNTAQGDFSVTPGGYQNWSPGAFSFAAGRKAKATHDGSFVWADTYGEDFYSFGDDSVHFRCTGGVRFFGYAGGLFAASVSWYPGAGSWTFNSDRNLKERLEALDVQAVLEKVSRLPISEWNYKGSPQRHIGAMAQDFHALFPLNDDDKRLNDLDLHGVALAAIQGLNQKVEEKDTEIKELKERLSRLEAFINKNTRTKD